MRFYFSVHQLHNCHEEKLDALARSHLKVWLGIQKHGVMDTAIFHPYILNIKAPSQVYNEAHAGSYAIIRCKGDKLVNHALLFKTHGLKESQHGLVNTQQLSQCLKCGKTI